MVFPASDGQYGVLAARSPLVTMLGAGEMTVTTTKGDKKEYYVAGGFANSNDNKLTLLADECTPVEDLDRDEAWDRIEYVRKLPADTEEAFQHKQELLNAARKRFNLVQLRGQRLKVRSHD